MKPYQKTGSKFTRKYGRSIYQLATDLKVSAPTLCKWERQGFDIFKKAEHLNFCRGNTRLHCLWANLLSRCGNPKDKKYKFYGGKGIKVLLEKKDLAVLWARDGADKMHHPSIDRKDENDHYTLENCRFVEMSLNRRRRWQPEAADRVIDNNRPEV